MTQAKDISIIVVNWNTHRLLTKCIDSIKNTIKQREYEVFVVDNASSDDSLKRAEENHPDTIILKNRRNLGFARATNLAIPYCKAGYILLLNPDTVVLEGAVDMMIGYMDTHLSVGAIGPRLISEDGRSQPSTAGSFPTLSAVFNEVCALTKLLPKCSWIKGLYIRFDENEPLEVDWVSGACLMVRREVIDRVGTLNEGFFMYFEDQEWCYRMKKAGYKIVFYPQARVIHFGNESVVKLISNDLTKNQISHREYLLNFNGPAKAFIASKLYFAGILVRCIFSLAKYIFKGDRQSLCRFKVLTKSLRLKGF